MAEISRIRARSFFTLRWKGVQSTFDIAVIAIELGAAARRRKRLRLLFDWSEIESWPFQAPSASAIRLWNSRAPSIVCAAIVHHHKWNKHAALISALLRLNNSQVKCFRVPERDSAIAWLESAQNISKSDQVRRSPDWSGSAN
jgi:SpoIIAA-like